MRRICGAPVLRVRYLRFLPCHLVAARLATKGLGPASAGRSSGAAHCSLHDCVIDKGHKLPACTPTLKSGQAPLCPRQAGTPLFDLL